MQTGFLNMFSANASQSTLKNEPYQSKQTDSYDSNKWEKEWDKAYDKTKDIEKVEKPEHKEALKKIYKKVESQLTEGKPTEKVEEMTELEALEAMNEEILALLAEGLQLPKEVIVEQLEALNQEPVDLLVQKNFMTLVEDLTGMTSEHLLSESETIKQIANLFHQLEDLKADFKDLLQQQTAEMLPSDTPLEQMMATQKSGETTTEATTLEAVLANSGEESEMGSVEQMRLELKAEGTEEGFATASGEGKVATSLGLDLPIQFAMETRQGNWQTHPFQNFTSEAVRTGLAQDTEIIRQMVERMELTRLDQTNELTMELHPKSLGKLSIKIAETQGIVTAQIKVDNEKAKEMLLQEIAVLQEKLEAQGVKIEGLQVDVREQTHQSVHTQEKQKASKRIEEILNKQLDDLKLEEEVAATQEATLINDSENEINLKV